MSALSTEGLNGFPIPVGTVMMWANNSAKPQLVANLESNSGFLVCDGRAFLISDYPDLYRVLGGVSNPYDVNDPSPPAAGYFRIPNCPAPDASSTYRGLLIGSTAAGTLVPAGSQVPITSASFTLDHTNLPSFPLDYDVSIPYEVLGSYYCRSVFGGNIPTPVYSKSVILNRQAGTGFSNRLLRDTVPFSSAGGIGKDSIAPKVGYTGANTPVDVTGTIVQGTFSPPTFEIVPIIRAKPTFNFV
jgi:hypothetical protein